MQLIRIGYIHDTGRRFGNLIVVLNQGFKKFHLGFSSKIEVPQLGSEPSKLGLARAGKFQLEFISTSYVRKQFDGGSNHKSIPLLNMEFLGPLPGRKSIYKTYILKDEANSFFSEDTINFVRSSKNSKEIPPESTAR